MSTKQNMYVGKQAEAQRIIDEINNCVIAWKLEESGINKIVFYMEDEANRIRDDVSNMQGQLQVLIRGLDKKSPKRVQYQTLLDKIDVFMKLFD